MRFRYPALTASFMEELQSFVNFSPPLHQEATGGIKTHYRDNADTESHYKKSACGIALLV